MRAEPDDDIDYTLLALLLLEEHGADFATEDVARAWLKSTAERTAYRILLENLDDLVRRTVAVAGSIA